MRIEITRSAAAEIESIFHYIAQQDERAADRVVTRVRQSIALLGNFPAIGREGLVTGTRELTVPNTPYKLIFEIEPDRIAILAVVHSRRNYPSP